MASIAERVDVDVDVDVGAGPSSRVADDKIVEAGRKWTCGALICGQIVISAADAVKESVC